MENLVHLIRRIKYRPLREFAVRRNFAYRTATAGKRRLPDFLIIGTERGGSTSLYETLDQHPQLVASAWKEIHYFTGGSKKADNYEKGEAWYRAHFPLKRDLPAETKTFEATPLYLYHPLCAERIFNLLPAGKLIAILRNPTERAISHYFMNKRKGHETLPMLEAFQREEHESPARAPKKKEYRSDYLLLRDDYTSRGLYAEQLQRYLKFFPSQQILLLSSEEFFKNPHTSLRQAFEFLDVDPNFQVKDVAPRNRGKEKGEVPAEARKYLDDYFRPHNQALYELTGKDFGW